MIRAVLTLGLFALAACGPARYCSLLVDCTCNCTNGSSQQINGKACQQVELDADERLSCTGWAESKREATDTACLQSCTRSHGDSTATCQFALIPGNPVATVSASTCPGR